MRGLIPSHFTDSTKVEVGNFKITKRDVKILVQHTPGTRKYINVNGISLEEMKYHLARIS